MKEGLKLKFPRDFFQNATPIDIDYSAIRAECAPLFEEQARRELENWNFLNGKIVGAEDP